jgi:hypothetical protein
VERRRALRRDLRETIRRSPLGDTRGWVRDFEALMVRTLEDTAAETESVSQTTVETNAS